jgi:hypothetical protein
MFNFLKPQPIKTHEWERVNDYGELGHDFAINDADYRDFAAIPFEIPLHATSYSEHDDAMIIVGEVAEAPARLPRTAAPKLAPRAKTPSSSLKVRKNSKR